MERNSTRAEAERLLGISEKLLQKQDLNGSKEFAILAQETDPLMEGTDQIVAVVDVLMASQKPISNTHDWYAILQLDRRTEDLDIIKRQYRRLALLLHPDKNKFPFADSAFRLVADAWAVLSDGGRKSVFDSEVGLFAKVDLVASRNQRDHQQQQQQQQQNKLPVRRTTVAEGSASVKRAGPGASGGETRSKTFWTTCPYCYNLYEYPSMYEECCMRCQNCSRAFHAAVIPSLPPVVPGKEEYYCCWGFFPVGFGDANSGGGGGEKQTFPVTPNSVPPPNSAPTAAAPPRAPAADGGFVSFQQANVTPTPKKRGRPRKNPPI